jgi:hypothetical protein
VTRSYDDPDEQPDVPEPLVLPPVNPLSAEQRARAEALRVARTVLVQTGFASSQVGTKFTTSDLLEVADWIVSGPPDLTAWARPASVCEACGHMRMHHSVKGCVPLGERSACPCVGYVGYMDPRDDDRDDITESQP